MRLAEIATDVAAKLDNSPDAPALLKKLAAWEQFYNLSRPHGAHGGKAPYEALQSLLVHNQTVPVD